MTMNLWLLRRIVAASKKQHHEEISLSKEDMDLLVEIRVAYTKHLREQAQEERQKKVLAPRQPKEEIHFASDEGEEEKAKGSGPPKFWEEFLDANYEGGKALVENTNAKTKDMFPRVRVTTLMKTDKAFMKQLMAEYRRWLGERNERGEGAPKAKPVFGVKFPESYSQEARIQVPPDASKFMKKNKVELKDVLDATGFAAMEDLPYNRPKVKLIRENGVEVLVVESEGYEVDIARKFDFTNKVVINDLLRLIPETPAGSGTKILTSQIEKARELGMQKMQCKAYRDDPTMVGYKVWPRLGYDGPIPVEKTGLPPKFQRALTEAGHPQPWRIQQLYSLGAEAIEWWDKHGDSFEAEFDLNDGSPSMQIFTAYVKKKGGYDALVASS